MLWSSMGLYAQTHLQDESTQVEKISSADEISSLRQKRKKSKKKKNERPREVNGIELLHASEGEVFLGRQNEDGSLTFQGGVVARVGDVEIRADKVKIFNESGEIYAQGDVTFERDGRKFKGSKLIYNRKKNQGVFYDANGNLQNLYVQSGKTFIAKAGKNVLLEDVFWTAPLELNPEFYFTAKKLWFYEDNQVVGISVVYYVGGVPVFYLPILFQTNLGTGILSSYGYSSSLGHYFQNTYYFLIAPAKAKEKFFSQVSSKLLFDYYQFDGFLFESVFQKRSSRFNYTFDFAVADHKEKTLTNSSVYDFKYTNLLLQPDGTYNTKHQFWWKAKMDMNAVLFESADKDQDLTLSFSFEHYRHRAFDNLYGNRIEPRNTVEMFQFNKSYSSSTIDSLEWNLKLNKSWKNSRLTLDVSRQLTWYQKSTGETSGYKPTYDILPKVVFDGSYLVKKQGKGVDGPIITQMYVEAQIERYYSEGDFDKNIFSYNVYNRWLYYLYFLPWLKFTPSAGLGSQMFVTDSTDDNLNEKLDKKSYEYLFTDSTLTLGISEVNLQAQHSIKYSFADFAVDDIFSHLRSHYMKFSFNSEVGNFFYFSSFISRDLRKYNFPATEAMHWSPWQTDVFFAINFADGFKTRFNELIQYKKEHYIELVLFNSFVFNTFYQKPQSNEASISFRVGGYDSPIIYRLMNIQAGISLFNDFLTTPSSYLTFNWEIDLLLHRFWRLKLGASSAARRFEAYNSTPFWQDTANSLNVFKTSALSQGNFTLEDFFVTLEHDLHHWVLQLSYKGSAHADYYDYGTTSEERVSYYEHSIYFSMKLKQFEGFGIPTSQVYNTKTSL